MDLQFFAEEALEKEIKNFEESVQNRIIELEKWGERHE